MKFILLFIALAAQAQINVGVLDQIGTSLPASCSVGQRYTKTDATAAAVLYICTATNTWTQQVGTGSSSIPDEGLRVSAASGAVRLSAGSRRIGSAAYVLSALCDATPSAGTGFIFWYMTAAGVFTAGHNVTATITSGSCAIAGSVTTYPQGSMGLGYCAVTSGVVGACTASPQTGRDSISAGAGITVTGDAPQTIAIDPTATITAAGFASSSTSAGEYKMFEASANGSDYVSFLAPDSITTIQKLKMSAAANTAGQTMQFGAPSGNISQASWATPLWTGQSNANGYFDWTLGTAPGNPASGDIRLYPKTGSTLCAKTSAGTETCYGAGGGSVTKVPVPVQIVSPPANVSGTLYSTGNCKAPASTASGSNDLGAYSYAFPNTSTPTLECFVMIPGGWDGTAVSVKFVGGGNTPGSGSSVRFAIKTSCVADGSAISSPTYGTATNLDLTSLSGGGNQKSATLALTLDASCSSAAGKGMWVQIQRPNAGSDDWSANYHVVRLNAEFMVSLQ